MALSLAAVLVVIPITIRNYVVFGAFVPVSINGGLTLWQGVADAGGREVGARRHDTLVAEEESIRYGRPDYSTGGPSRTGSGATTTATGARSR